MNDTSKNSLQVGTLLGDKWVVLELLGRGGMGEVYRVHQLNLKRDVAIKVISAKLLGEIDDDEYEAEACLERFNREVQVMAQIRHPNVLQIYDCGSLSVKRGKEDVPVQYIVMEYVPGGTLRSTMSAEGFHPEDDRMREWLRAYFLPLLDGVRALHEMGVVHRDLKPENVLLDGNIPKIADFGLARSSRAKPFTHSVDMRGTPPYMSPEHFLDLKRTDVRTDVYALGKILYEAAAGKMGSDQIPFKQAKLKEPETFFYQRLDQVIQAATAEDRNQRLASVETLKQAIEEVLAEGGKKIVPIATDSSLTRRHSRLAWALIIALVVAASLITGLGIMHVYMGDHGPPSPLRTSLSGPDQGRTSNQQENPSSAKTASPAQVLQGKDQNTLHLIPAGTVTLPANFDSTGGGIVKVDSFYLDETQITNQQYVHFLNHVLAKTQVQDGVVREDKGKPWLLLGEVMPGYEPIVYRIGRFSVQNAAHAACPVLRVTAYGASAYAHFYGERLMTGAEWLQALKGGGSSREETSQPAGNPSKKENSTGRDEMMHQMMAPQPQSAPPKNPTGLQIPAPVILFKPNRFGIRGLNGTIAEWGVQTLKLPQATQVAGSKYLALGGILSRPGGDAGHSAAISRHPWEAFPTVGFRCALSVSKAGR